MSTSEQLKGKQVLYLILQEMDKGPFKTVCVFDPCLSGKSEREILWYFVFCFAQYLTNLHKMTQVQ